MSNTLRPEVEKAYDWREDLGVLHELACLHPGASERRGRLAAHLTARDEEIEQLRRRYESMRLAAMVAVINPQWIDEREGQDD